MEVNGSDDIDFTMEVNGLQDTNGLDKVNGSDKVVENYKKFPQEIVNVDEATEERVLRHFKGPMAALVQVGPEKWILPKLYPQCAEKLYNFEARSDDIWISTYSRSGTTWTQEMIWLLCNDLNYEAAKAAPLMVRFPYFELEGFLPGVKELDEPNDVIAPSAVEILGKMTSQRFIKTHLPIQLMPHDALAKGCKIVYVARNPKDVLASLSHFVKNPGILYEGNFQQLADFFIDDLIVYSPFFEHIKDGWNRRNESNVLFLFYEDLVMDLKNSLKKLANFLERPLSDNDLPELMQHLNIKNFKQNESINIKLTEQYRTGEWEFVRRGKVGGNPEITPEIAEKVDAWTEKRLKGTGIKFPHQLRHKLEMYNMQANKQWKK
ncbi:Luciferin sulfotransferase [Pseudolycoriella hygida]|uniref:Luciferin sulfotransferase n=1 Tax=Pseudolycoriella hygida TaxID=35572 RepID=A0A9Q0NBS3_9DIPT|nr:Luciferin sulfotransferase [Pseudolycoriella hygida]